MKKRIGDVNRIKNKARKFGSADTYLHLRVQQPNGNEEHLLLTDAEMNRARLRAARNPEDLVNPCLLRDLID